MRAFLSPVPNQAFGCGPVLPPLCLDLLRPQEPHGLLLSDVCLCWELLPIPSQENSVPVSRQPGPKCRRKHNVPLLLPVTTPLQQLVTADAVGFVLWRVQLFKGPLESCAESRKGEQKWLLGWDPRARYPDRKYKGVHFGILSPKSKHPTSPVTVSEQTRGPEPRCGQLMNEIESLKLPQFHSCGIWKINYIPEFPSN